MNVNKPFSLIQEIHHQWNLTGHAMICPRHLVTFVSHCDYLQGVLWCPHGL